MAQGRHESLVHMLEAKASKMPDVIALVFVEDGEETTRTYAQLTLRARVIAGRLLETFRPGDRLLLVYPPGISYIEAFFGCLYAGIIAVPAYPPDPSRLERTVPRLAAILKDCTAAGILTTSAIASMAELLVGTMPELGSVGGWIATDDADDAYAWHMPVITPQSLAFLQYTSGSTGTPKGVMLSHASLLANLTSIQTAFQLGASSRGVIWLPPYHDMGLIGGILSPLYTGFPVWLTSPLAFLKKPLLWLELISRHQATHSGGPNFAYDLCCRVAAREDISDRGLDLSSWILAFNGAEPVRHTSLARFSSTFAPYGFSEKAMYPCYGLAEATLIVSGGRAGAGAELHAIDSDALFHHQANDAMVSCEAPVDVVEGDGQLRRGSVVALSRSQLRVSMPIVCEVGQPIQLRVHLGTSSIELTGRVDRLVELSTQAEPGRKDVIVSVLASESSSHHRYLQAFQSWLWSSTDLGAEAPRVLVACGSELPEHHFVVVDPTTQERVEDGRVGEVWFQGPSVAVGYWNRPEATNETFHARIRPIEHEGSHEWAAGEFLRTGDLGFVRDGQLFITGRIKDLIVVHGVNHYPQDLEQTVERAHPAIRKGCTAVCSLDDQGGDRVLVVAEVDTAKLAATEDVAAVAHQVRLDIMRHHDVAPASIVLIPPGSLPKTSSGKVQRHACRLNYLRGDLDRVFELRLDSPGSGPSGGPTHGLGSAETDASLGRVYADDDAARPPDDELAVTTRALCDIFSAVLSTTSVTPTSNLLQLGGDSITAIQCVAQIRERLGVEVTLGAIFEAPTVRDLAVRVRAVRRDVLPPVQAVDAVEAVPLSYSQQRLWFLHELEPTSSAYNTPVVLRLHGPLDVVCLRRALEVLCERHEALRTRFVSESGVVTQVVDRDVVALSVVTKDTDAEERVVLSQTSWAPFDLRRGPVVRATLIERAPDEHVLCFVMPHIVTDGWSLSILGSELCTVYSQLVAGERVDLPAVPFQYRDYAAWQRRWLNEVVLTTQLAYWKAKLAGAPTLELPTDAPRPVRGASGHGSAETCVISSTALSRLRALCEEERSTVAMALQAIVSAVLARYGGVDDVTIGVPIANRNQAGTEKVVGFFMNTLALRTDVSGEPSFRELLRRARTVALEAYEHQDAPFERVVSSVNPERRLDRTPLFQVLLNTLNIPPPRLQMHGMKVSVDESEVRSKFDITIYVNESPEVLRLNLVYQTDLFLPARMKALLAHIALLVASSTASPDTPITAFALEDPAAPTPNPREPLVREPWPALHELVTQAAVTVPSACAIADGVGRFRFVDIEERSNRLAWALCAAGVVRGDTVAIHAGRHGGLVVAMLGILKAGAAWVIVDPRLPEARQAAIVKAARPRVSISFSIGPSEQTPDWSVVRPETTTWTHQSFSWTQALPPELAEFPTTRPPIDVRDDDLAYVAFTSGTTGVPKGIQGTHAPVAHFLSWYRRTYEPTADDRVSMLSGLAHDPLLRDIFVPLQVGATLHIPTTETLHDGRALARWLSDNRITIVHLTPSIMELLLEGAASHTPLAALRLVCSGGERLHGRHVRRMKALAPHARIVNFYGATETPQAMAFFDATALKEDEVAPLGVGIDDVQLLVATPFGMPAGVSERGEILIRTPYLARGYLESDRSSDRFRQNPWNGGDEDDIVYVTGDLGRYLPDGSVEIVGRVDDQVKIRGFRVEPAEVSATLQALPGVERAVVIARDDMGPGLVLVAYVTLAQATSEDALLAELRSRLPEAMCPRAVVVLEHLPLTHNGKLDRRALPAPRQRALEEREPPTSPLEQELAMIFGEVLAQPVIGATDNFFALGGHSILATKLAGRIRDARGIDLPLRVVFEAPSVRQLARVLREQSPPAPHTSAQIPRRATTSPAPMSFHQEQMWRWHRDTKEPATYHVVNTVTIRGPLDVAALRAAVAAVVRRHEVLRTTLHEHDGVLTQRVTEQKVPVGFSDLSMVPAVEHPRILQEQLGQISRPAFDLSHEVPLRVHLFQCGQHHHVLNLTIHHIAVDGWSFPILVRELMRAYSTALDQAAGNEVPLPLQYADYAAWQRARFRDGVFDASMRAWRDTLAGIHPISLPGPTGPETRTRGQCVATIDPPQARQLKATLTRLGTSLFVASLAAYARALWRLSNEDDVTISAAVANRQERATHDLIGFFVNTVLLRLWRHQGTDIRSLLRHARAVAVHGFEHEHAPIERVVDALRVHEPGAERALYSAYMNVLQIDTSVLPLGELSVEPFPYKNVLNPQFDLVFKVFQRDDIQLFFVYNPARLSDGAAASLVADMHATFLEMAMLGDDV